MILLDTNVVSEVLQGRRNSDVQTWFNRQRIESLFLCTPVLAELRFGIERLPVGRRRDVLENAVHEFERNVLADRVLPLDRDCAYAYGQIMAQRQQIGRPISVMDALIAAVAAANRATLATRDTSDFEHLGIALVNPFMPA
jgi:hypothetical protein